MSIAEHQRCAPPASSDLGNDVLYRPEIDGLRTIAVGAVIANHFFPSLCPSGFLGVDIFFVISGYVITGSLSSRIHHNIYDMLAWFYARRVKRIIPALVVCIIVTAFVGAMIINSREYEYGRIMKAGFFALLGASNIYFFNDSADYFSLSAAYNLFTQTWSLGVEEQFYLVFPLLCWTFGLGAEHSNNRRGLLLALVALTTLSLIAFVWLDLHAVNGAYFMMPNRFWELSLGCIVALTLRNNLFPKDPGAVWSCAGAVILVIALLSPQASQLYTTLAVAIGASALIMTIAPTHPIYGLLASRGMVVIGLQSYSLYLWHWSVLALSRWTVGVHIWSAPFQLLAILGLSSLSYFFVEHPLRRASWSRFPIITIGFGLIGVGCAASTVYLLKTSLAGKLYTGAPAQMAAKGVETLVDGKRLNGTIHWRANDCVLASNEDVGKRFDLDHCALGSLSSRRELRFLVVGNSYSAAELEMYSVLGDTGQGMVSVTSSWGASPTAGMPNNSPWSKANAYYWSDVVPNLISQMNSGDVLVMINDLSDLSPELPTNESQSKLKTMKKDLTELAKALHQRGMKIIFQSGTPFLREAQCSPDMAVRQWFNFGATPNCIYYTKQYTLNRLAKLREMLSDVERENKNFYVYDFLPILCPEDLCHFQNALGVFLYRDMYSHPSLEASALGRESFLAVAKRAMQ